MHSCHLGLLLAHDELFARMCRLGEYHGLYELLDIHGFTRLSHIFELHEEGKDRFFHPHVLFLILS